jgi:uncharacterized protein (DUF433 family)
LQFGRISIDPSVCHGQAGVKGTRMPVRQIVQMPACGGTFETLLAEYPFLSPEDIWPPSTSSLPGRMDMT